jgi:hypothetical protein
VEKGKITEIETIVARENDFAFNAENVLKTKDQDWSVNRLESIKRIRIAAILGSSAAASCRRICCP